MITDGLNSDLRLFYALVLSTPERMANFRNLDRDMIASWALIENITQQDVLNRYIESCGVSATRLWQLLTSEELSGSQIGKGTDISNAAAVENELKKMIELPTHILLRFQIYGKLVGHSYNFLSIARKTGDPIRGYIYQTNYGLYDYLDWLKDKKSEMVLDLKEHLQELSGCGFMKKGHSSRDSTYRKLFLLSGQKWSLEKTKLFIIKHSYDPTFKVTFLWRPVLQGKARQNMIEAIKSASSAESVGRGR